MQTVSKPVCSDSSNWFQIRQIHCVKPENPKLVWQINYALNAPFIIRGNMIEVYKILTNKYDSRVNLYQKKQQDSKTRGHSLKLVNNTYHYDLRKFYFAPRIVNVWNSLAEIVISADTTDTFKRRLDNFGNTRIYYMTIRLS